MSNLKTPQIRSRAYLNGAKGQSCIACGNDDGTTVPAHYSAKYANKLGKGAHIKAHDHMTADLCLTCHQSFDNYTGGRNYRHGVRFLLAIFDTQRRRKNQGLISRKDGLFFEPYDVITDAAFAYVSRLYMDKNEELADETFEALFCELMQAGVDQIQAISEGKITIKGMK